MDKNLHKLIRIAVREGISDALTKYGVDTEDPSAMQADMRHLRQSRIGSEELIKWSKRSAITAAITSLLVALWHGIKSMINNGN